MKDKHYPSLLVVTNREDTLWYEVKRDEVEKLGEFQTEDPKFSDNEGHFEKGAKSGQTGQSETFASGSVREEGPHKKHAAEVHLKEMAKKTRKKWEDKNYQHLMVARPGAIKQLVDKSFDKQNLNIDYKEIEGNYTHASKQQLLDLAKDSLKVVN